MPAIAPSYLYAFFALVTVSTILISAFAAYTTTLRTIPEIEQLKNLLTSVASKSYELVTLTTVTKSASQAIVQLPSSLGNKQYWIKLRSESSETWVEGALGLIHQGNIANQAYLPKAISANGNYSSGYGPAVLKCYLNGTTVSIHLSSWRENV